MARCSHKNVQDYTEICLDCGKNIWDDENLDEIKDELYRNEIDRYSEQITEKNKKDSEEWGNDF